MADLQSEIASRQRIVKSKSASPTDAELDALKAEYAKVKEEHEQIFGSKEMTDEQRLKMAIAAAERSEVDAEAKLARAEKGDFAPEPLGRPLPASARLDEIRARTAAIREATKELRDIANPKKTPEQIALQSLKTRMATQKADLIRRIAEKDFSPRRKSKEVALDQEASIAAAEVQIYKDRFQNMLEKNKYDLKSTSEKVWIGTKEALNLSRSIKTSYDLSAVFRQGAFIVLRHPIRGSRSIVPMFKAMASERNALAIEAQIKSRPNAKLYEQSKLFLAPREAVHLSGMEEAFMSRLASRVPGVGASGRAYITFLNKLRADSFDAMHDNLIKKREASPVELKVIANYINVATGRGNLGKLAGATEALATTFFSPRLVASRFQLLAGQPMYHGTMRTRWMIAKEYGGFAIALGVIYGLASMAGGTVEDDTTSSDFGKIKFGNTRIDPMAGLSQTTVLLSRIASKSVKKLNGQVEDLEKPKYGGKDIPGLIGTFLRTKLAPVPGSALDVWSGKNVIGDKVSASKTFLPYFTDVGGMPIPVPPEMLQPLSMGDIYSVMEEQGFAGGTAIAILSIFGMGVQNYQVQPKKTK